MIRNIALLIGLLCLILGYTWYDSQSQQRPQKENAAPAASTEQTAPDFTFETQDGTKHKLSDYKGKTIVLNFWASWCAPCVVEFPAMVKLAESTQNDTVFIFLSQDDTDDAVTRFIKKHVPSKTNNVLIARDADKAVAENLYQTFKLPETYIIGPDLNIRDKIIGADVDWNGAEMRGKIMGSSSPHH